MGSYLADVDPSSAGFFTFAFAQIIREFECSGQQWSLSREQEWVKTPHGELSSSIDRYCFRNLARQA